MLRDSFFKKRSVQKRKNGAASPVPSIWPGISSPHGNGVTGKARHLAVSAVHEKGEPRKGRPIGHKKRHPKGCLRLGADYLGKVAPFKASPCRKYRFRQNPHRVATRRAYVRRQSFSEWMCLIPVVFNRDDDVHVLLDPLFDPLMGRFPVGTFFLEHFPIGFHEDRGGWDIGGFGTSQPKRNRPIQPSG